MRQYNKKASRKRRILTIERNLKKVHLLIKWNIVTKRHTLTKGIRINNNKL